MSETKSLISTAEAARLLNTSQRTIQRMIEKGELEPADKVSGRYLVDPDVVLKTRKLRKVS